MAWHTSWRIVALFRCVHNFGARPVIQKLNENRDVIDQLTQDQNVEILRDGRWATLNVIDVEHSENSDVSIIKSDINIAANPVEPSMEELVYGQDMYFLGFPYGMSFDVGELNRNFPVPLVKKCILSALCCGDDQNILILDGHNNPGFSGGPVVFRPHNRGDFRFAGVIHGYNPEYRVENGQLVPIDNTNSGIIIAYSINCALELTEAMSIPEQ